MSKYLQNAREEIRKAEARAGKYKGTCGQCRFSRIGLVQPYCVHPAVEVACFNADAGYDADRLADCSMQRGRSSPYGAVVCGPDGDLFEPKGNFFERLFGV